MSQFFSSSLLLILRVFYSCTCTSCSVVWPTSTRLGCVTGTSSRRTCCSTPRRASSSYATLAAPNTWFAANPMYPTFVPATTGPQSSYSGPLTTPQILVSIMVTFPFIDMQLYETSLKVCIRQPFPPDIVSLLLPLPVHEQLRSAHLVTFCKLFTSLLRHEQPSILAVSLHTALYCCFTPPCSELSISVV